MLSHLSTSLKAILFTTVICFPVEANIYSYVYNTRTGRPDLVTPLSTSTVQSGTNVTVSTNSDGSITISASGGSGGGSSALAVSIASTNTWTTQISSPTAAIAFDQSQFSGQLLPNATAFITIAYSTNSQTGNYIATSTDTVVEANCASACTLTLPNAIGIKGKVYYMKSLGTGAMTIATNASQTIDGSTTVTPMPNQFATIEVISNGSNWEIL